MTTDDAISAATITPPFIAAGGVSDTQNTKILANIEILLQNLDQYDTVAKANTPEADADIRHKFMAFLVGCEFQMSIPDFEDLLEESKAKPRNDGTVGWHHQLSQILLFLSEIRKQTISLNDLEEYGSLETAIRTILRHDSIEDFDITFEQFENDAKRRIEERFTHLRNKGIAGFDEERKKIEYQRLEQLMKNLKILSRVVPKLDANGNPEFDDSGKMVKTDLFPRVIDYIQNILHSPDSNPVLWIIKSLDGSHNLATMLSAPKFTAEKRRKYSNNREDLYGGRYSLPEWAAAKWPAFSEAIKNADNLMGSILFANFGYLAHVDQDDAYPGKRAKHKDGEKLYPSGIFKYLKRAITFKVPRGLNPLHIQLDEFEKRTGDPDGQKATRAGLFLKYSICPALEKYKQAFPNFFPVSKSKQLANENS